MLWGGWGDGLDFLAAIFPFSLKGDEKGKEDQFYVKAKGLSADVKEVIPKLLATRCIAREVNLRKTGQPGRHR